MSNCIVCLTTCMVSHHLSYRHLELGVGAKNKGTTVDVVGNIEALQSCRKHLKGDGERTGPFA